MGTDLKTIFDIGEELSNQKKKDEQILKEETASNEIKIEYKYIAGTIAYLAIILDKIIKKRDTAKYTNKPIKDIDKNKKDLENLKLIEKTIKKLSIMMVGGIAIVTTGFITALEYLSTIEGENFIETLMPNIILILSGICLGEPLYLSIKDIEEIKEIEEEIYEENPELKKNKKPRRLGTR